MNRLASVTARAKRANRQHGKGLTMKAIRNFLALFAPFDRVMLVVDFVLLCIAVAVGLWYTWLASVWVHTGGVR